MLVKPEDTCSIVVPAGLSDDFLAGFDARLKSLQQKDCRVVTLDCSQLENPTSSHVNVLWRAYQSCAEAGKEVRLKSPTPALIRVLQAMDLAEFFTWDKTPVLTQQRRAAQPEPGGVTRRYFDAFVTDVGGIDKALEDFLRFVARLQLPEVTEFELRTIFYEVATNIRTHGRAG
ncbi:MAG: STAS domain-containing protein, partial [Candidatus Zixiibacteriota bacterium]